MFHINANIQCNSGISLDFGVGWEWMKTFLKKVSHRTKY